MIKGSQDFMEGSSSLYVTTLPSSMTVVIAVVSGDMHLICHLTLQDHLIKGSCDSVERNSSLHVGLVAIAILVVEK